jgi:hypothetical protein
VWECCRGSHAQNFALVHLVSAHYFPYTEAIRVLALHFGASLHSVYAMQWWPHHGGSSAAPFCNAAHLLRTSVDKVCMKSEGTVDRSRRSQSQKDQDSRLGDEILRSRPACKMVKKKFAVKAVKALFLPWEWDGSMMLE